MKLIALPIGLLLLAGCSSPPPAAPQVASIATPVASASAASPQRPQLRMDTSDEEEQRYWTAYEDCLVAHGVKTNPVDQPGPAGPGRRLDQSGEPKSAYVTCKDKLPLQPPELDEDRNPNFAAQWNDNVKCLRAHGVMVHVTEPGSWTYDSSDTPLPENEEEIQESCLREAFGGKK